MNEEPDQQYCGLGIRGVAMLRASLVRNVLRLVDWLPIFYLVGIAFLLTSDRYRRLGDRIGDTVVVRS